MRTERDLSGSANLGLLIGIFQSGIVTKSWISSVQGTTSTILFAVGVVLAMPRETFHQQTPVEDDMNAANFSDTHHYVCTGGFRNWK